MNKRRALILIVILFSVELSWSQTKVLFVGNSYTYYNDMPNMVQQIAKANEIDVIVHQSVNGGVSLRDHWNENLGLESKRIIQEGDYDFVVIQDQSMTPIRDPESTLTYGKKLSEIVKNNQGQLVIYQTWSRESNPASQEVLDNTFLKLKDSTGGILAPVAEGWQLAKKEYPKLKLYDADGSHPSELGSYLAALIFYLTIFDQDINSFKTVDIKRLPLPYMKQCEWLALQVSQKEK